MEGKVSSALGSSGAEAALQPQFTNSSSESSRNEVSSASTRIIPYTKQKRTPWPEFASELYRLSDRRLSAKLVRD
jgi:hypothetical protein